ncbi:hypothetical protein [Streptomyces sp. NRRL S-1448]|uniref:hypothetical protein n=1 Tax=Streptomyces sp. NRRL S-1448 TaxID=1463883 RepID=UPI0004C0BE7A|nr:hypothetical protein [Streptomyces sp. NRRL S-1448]
MASKAKESERYTFSAQVGDEYDTYSAKGALVASSRKEAMDKIDAGLRSRGYEVLDLDLRKE